MFLFASTSGLSSRGGTHRAPAASPIPRIPVGGFGIELRASLDLDQVASAWTALARRALVASPFAEHALLAAAARHLPEGRRLQTLLVWSGETLVGVAPTQLARSGLGQRRLVPWRVDLLPAATPLLDREVAGPAIEAMLRFARERGTPLVLADAPQGTALAHLLRAAGLAATPCPETVPQALAPETMAEPTAAIGLDIHVARHASEIRDAVETFLALDAETAGAQREPLKREPIVRDPGRASLVRTATRRAARERACRVAIARRAGAPVAAAILVRDHVWLTARSPESAPALAALLARRPPIAPTPRTDWAALPAAAPRPAIPGRALAAARRLLPQPMRAS
ncbi:hypothetical protein [Salinarimonas ramus]|uniref:Uncharacterized protein n=1 Tax=Salinarimonas ramus TaxID=690164 RepID=A0A917Q5G8_9HYPH|nr:hypothetical protein [Salinarimonas ramus]GGK25194.1 hypothetical protein GCM10011322_09710 [Salinarimonas ramus]